MPADLDGPEARRFERVPAMRLGQSDDAEAGTKALLGVRLRPQDEINEGGGVWADPLGLSFYLARGPAGIPAMAGGHVLRNRGVPTVAGRAHMGGNPLPLMKDLDRPAGDARPELLLQQLVRHRIIVLLDLDMVVEPGLALDPFGVLVRLGR